MAIYNLSFDKQIDNTKVLFKYSNYIEDIIKLNVSDITQDYFEEIDSYEFDLLAEMIVNKLFNDNSYILTEFEKYKKTIKISREKHHFQGGTFKLFKNNKIITIIPNKKNIGCIILYIHEFIHYLFIHNEIELKDEYAEILPILFEINAANTIDQIGEGNSRELMLLNRLNTIKWYYCDMPNMEDNIIKRFKKLNGNGLITFENFPKVIELIKEYPWLQTDSDIRQHINERYLTSASYGLGLLYSESLYSYMDENIGDKLYNILIGNLSLQDLLNYYNINLNNEETYNILEEKIKRVIK